MPSVDAASRWVLDRAPRIGRAVACAAALLTAGAFALHLARGSLAYLGLLEDDYFYYAIVADKLASLGRLTYDGVTTTNGFHPLWFLVLLSLRLVTGGLNAAFYAMLALVFAASMIASYELSVRLARTVGASVALAPAAALVFVVPTFEVVSDGMETALDVPLVLWLLVEAGRPAPIGPRRAARLGVIASLAVLARLDVALLVLVLAVGWLVAVRPPVREAVRAAAAFCAAGAAVPVYAAFNVLAFGALLPTSALAKQLVRAPGIQLSYLHVVAQFTQYGRAAGPALVAGAASLLVLWRRRQVPGTSLFAAGAALLFCALFFFANALSGWIFFGWYAYPLAAGLVVALSLVGVAVSRILSARPRAIAGAAAVVAAACLAAGQAARGFLVHGPLWTVEDNGLLAMSLQLGDRMRGRDGRYAMGAIGGFATYLLHQPMVQIEGLVADRAMIDHVARDDDLATVLRAYGVDYLVVSTYRLPTPHVDGCYLVTQPSAEWSGRRTHKMHGSLCAEPIDAFHTPGGSRPWSIFTDLDTLVFDVRAPPGGPTAP